MHQNRLQLTPLVELHRAPWKIIVWVSKVLISSNAPYSSKMRQTLWRLGLRPRTHSSTYITALSQKILPIWNIWINYILHQGLPFHFNVRKNSLATEATTQTPLMSSQCSPDNLLLWVWACTEGEEWGYKMGVIGGEGEGREVREREEENIMEPINSSKWSMGAYI